MKIAITGKGGVGKTTLSGTLARLYAEEGYRVVAVDADPDANLASSIGLPKDSAQKLTPLADMKDLVEERTGMKPGTTGGFFTINPKVDDIPEKYSVEYKGIKMLVMGTVDTGGSGCVCAEHVLLRNLMAHLVLERKDVVIMDMEAGVEHLGRGTAQAVDAFIVVVEPGARSVQTAEKVKQLANDIGVKQVMVVGSKIRKESDKQFIIDSLSNLEVIGFLSYDEKVVEADLKGIAPYDNSPKTVEEVKDIKKRLEKLE